MYTVLYTSPAPDPLSWYLGSYSSKEKAEQVRDQHMSEQKERYPKIPIDKYCYTICESEVDQKIAVHA